MSKPLKDIREIATEISLRIIKETQTETIFRANAEKFVRGRLEEIINGFNKVIKESERKSAASADAIIWVDLMLRDISVLTWMYTEMITNVFLATLEYDQEAKEQLIDGLRAKVDSNLSELAPMKFGGEFATQLLAAIHLKNMNTEDKTEN